METTATLEAAAEIVKTAPPDLMLTNVHLPGITGRDAMRLKGLSPQLPVLMISRLPDHEVIREWAGEDGFDI